LRSSAESLPRKVLLVLVVAVASAVAAPSAGAVQDIVWYSGICSSGNASMVHPFSEPPNLYAGVQCPFDPHAQAGNQGLWLYGHRSTPGGHVAHWEADAPSGMAIVAAHAPVYSDYDGSPPWGQFFYWGSGSSGYLANLGGGSSPWGWQSFAPSRYFGWELSCNAAKTGCNSSDAWMEVANLELETYEYQTPTILAGPNSGSHNLWYQAGHWVRGSFPIDVAAQDPSGVCRLVVNWNGQVAQDTGDRGLDPTYWDQCDPGHDGSWQNPWPNATINTADAVPTDATNVPLELLAHNASYNPGTGKPDWTDDVEYLNVDNDPVGLALSGSSHDVPVTAGTQYVTATATSGPSGVGAIYCSQDGGSWTSERMTGGGTATAAAQVGVDGLGQHQISCYAANQALDAAGRAGTSPTQTWSVKIGEPVQSGITFARVIRDCRRVRVREELHGHAHYTHVLRCHSITRDNLVKHASYGQRTTINGWFATADGTALGHVPVSIVAAPDDGSDAWHAVTVVRTAPDGSWQATVPPGPSRLIEAVYDGGPLTERATSQTVKLLVPASSSLHVSQVVTFGSYARFWGALRGGYVPATGAIVVVEAFDRAHWRNIATVRTDSRGRWQARYYISGGAGSYPIRLHMPRQADYPWAAAVTPPHKLVVTP